jgi:uncharacterized protein YjbI with pentapeptide repeats
MIKCVGTDSAISWNQTGPQGLAGVQGPSGAPGAQGPAGPAGAAGNGDITASAVFLAAHVCYGADLSGLQFHGVMTAGLARNCIFDNADLSGATMTGVEFHGSFENATLNNAVFDNSSLGSDFKNAKAIGASFASVWFAGDYTGADFTGAILKGAHIGGVDFSGVNFTGADLRGSGNEMGQHTWDTWMVTTSATTIWSNTLCSDGTNSDNPANNGTCVGH